MRQTRRNKLVAVVTIMALALTMVLSSASLIFAASGPEMPVPKKIKNGKKVTITGKIPQAVDVIVKNKKTGQVISVMVEAVKAAG